MSNLSRALAWAGLGIAVFPCFEKDTFEGETPKHRKAPRTKRGFKDATTDQGVIEKWWTENPDHLVGITTGDRIVVLDIDMDSEKGKDGWFSILEQDLEVPDTFHVTTSSGGSHYFYRHPAGEVLSPLQDVLLPDGVKLEAVDRRSGGSYVIAWSDEVPTSLDDLAPCPDWLRGGRKTRSTATYSGTTDEWIAQLPAAMSDVVSKFIQTRIPRVDFNHATMISRQAALVSLGARGYGGVANALGELRNEWLRTPYDTPEHKQAWDAAFAGAVAKFGGNRPASEASTNVSPDPGRVEHFFQEELAKREAHRRVEAQYFVGSREITWSELRSKRVNYIVDSLVPSDAIVFLVARRNLGKTYTYIDMICHIALGWPWLGKSTRQTKTTVVLGEGLTGFYERVEAWCSFHEVPIANIESHLTFVSPANLNNDLSLEVIQETIERAGSELVIFDTWSGSSGVRNEDDAAITAETLNRAKQVAPNGTLLFTHHPRKSDEKGENPVMRGSSAIDGRADVVMTMYRDKKFHAESGKQHDWFSLSTEYDHAGKNRTAKTETIRGIYLHNHEGLAVLRHFDSETVSTEVLEVQKFLTREMTVQEFSEESGRTVSTSRRYLDKAVEEEYALVKKGSGKVGNLYSLAPRNPEIDFRRLLDDSQD